MTALKDDNYQSQEMVNDFYDINMLNEFMMKDYNFLPTYEMHIANDY